MIVGYLDPYGNTDPCINIVAPAVSSFGIVFYISYRLRRGSGAKCPVYTMKNETNWVVKISVPYPDYILSKSLDP